MRSKRVCLSIFFIFLAGCSSRPETPSPATQTPTPPPQPTSTATLFTAASEIPRTQIAPIEGTTTAKINVRAHPSKESPALGMLDFSVKVQIIGKDQSGEWYEILYADSSGWASAQYIQINPAVEIPLSASLQPTAIPTHPPPGALQDGDSMQAPLASVILAPASARALQLNGDLSAADAEDWIQFQSQSGLVAVRIQCGEGVLTFELWNRGTRSDSFSLPCGGEKMLAATTAEVYALRVSAPFSGELRYIRYIIFVKSVQ